MTGETPLGPGIPWRTQMLGESQVCDRDGRVLARLTLEDGEGHVAADVELAGAAAARPDPRTATGSPSMTLPHKLAWHAMNTHGALSYRIRHARRGFPWQAWPAADLPDEILPPASPRRRRRRAPRSRRSDARPWPGGADRLA